MLSNLSNNNSGNPTKNVVEKKHYEDIEKRLDELQDEIDSNTESISQNAQDISGLDERVGAVENNSTFPNLNTNTINPATGDNVEITSDLNVDGKVEADSIETDSLTVNGTSFTTVKDNAAQAKSIAENAENKAEEAYDLADALSDELADYKADNEQSFTTGTMNADSVITDSIAAQTINTNDFETTNAEIDKLYVDTIKATGFLELPTAGQQYYTITIPAKTTASFSGVYTSDNNVDFPFYFTVSDGAVIYKQNSTEIIKDISFDRETGNTKVRVKTSTNITYISSALDNNPVTIEDGGNAYADYVFIPQKTGGYLIRGYDDTTTEVYIAGVLRAYAMSVEEEIIERTSVDFLKVNASIELPEDWDAGGTISYSTGEENQYISAQTKAGVTKPTWTSPIHSTIGSLSYSCKLVDEATIASYKGISETRQTQTISITDEASLQQLTAFHWTKNGTYWQPYETTRITIGDHTMWIDPTESNQGIRFYDNQVIADGTWEDTPVEEANVVPVNLVIFDAPSELSFPITHLGDRTTVHGEITATCFKGNVLGNVTGNADTATNATCFNSKTYAEACADILAGCAADSNKFNGKTYQEACADILAGNAATATNATCFDGHTYECAKADILSGCASEANNATCFNGCTYAQAKADILSGCASEADNATCFDGCTYAQAKADILSGCASEANNATCFGGCTYECAKADILSGTAAQANCVDIDTLTTSSYPLIMESTTCELGKSGTCSITFTPSSGVLETTQVSTTCIENSGTTKSQYLCATCDLNVDGNAYITGDLTVSGTITTTHSEEVVTPSENIILRDGATTPVASGCYSGFTVTNYDGQLHNLEVGADKDGTLHVGVVGGTMEPVATRATEACMENDYVAHWDSTGTDLVTKGASCTHDLCINGCATVSDNLTVTGTLTADLTGTADNATKFDGCTYAQAKADILSGNAASATNSTCFGGCTYAQAKADILSGNAASATNSTCFNGCTYAQAKADILSGNAATATNATCFNGCTYAEAKTDILSGCAADSAKLGNKAASCYIDNSSTAQTKAGALSIGAPAACTSTSAGGQGAVISNAGVIDLYRDSCPYVDFHYQKYCGDFSSRIANLYASNSCNGVLRMTVNNGKGCTTADTTTNYDFYSNGTFTGASTICASTNIYSNGCPVVTTGTLPTVAPGYNCTGTSNYVVTTKVCCAEKADWLAGCAARIFCGTTANDYTGFAWGSFSDEAIPGQYGNIIQMQTGTGAYDRWGYQLAFNTSGRVAFRQWSNTTSVSASWKCFIDNSGGQTIYGNLTIPTACGSFCGNLCGSAQKVCRNAITSNASCHLALLAGNNGADNTCIYVSSACPLTFNPATGVLTACCIKGYSRVIVGSPTACTSTVTGIQGACYSPGGMDVFACTPYINFHHNNACANYSHRIIANNNLLQVTATNATGCTDATQTANFYFCSDGTFDAPKLKNGQRYRFERLKSDNGGRATIHLLYDMTCAVCCANCGYAINGTAYSNRTPTQQASATYFSSMDFAMYMPYGSSGVANSRAFIYYNSCSNMLPIIVTRNDGKIYAGMCMSGSGRYISYDVMGSSEVIGEACLGTDDVYKDASGCTYTISKSGTLASSTICASNASCASTVCRQTANTGTCHLALFAGNTAVANAGILVSSACPLTYNPATGVLTATCFMVGSCPVALICDIPAIPTCVACAECVDLDTWVGNDLYLVGTPHVSGTTSYTGPRRLIAAQKANTSCLYYSMDNKNLYASGDKFTKDCQFVLSGCTLTITM